MPGRDSLVFRNARLQGNYLIREGWHAGEIRNPK